jgi:3-mercaptopyruvate sulfurtransferase SseA
MTMQRKKTTLLIIVFSVLLASACMAQPAQPTSTSTAAPTFTPPPARPPATEAEVPRVSLEDAKAALDSGTAVVVDVRSPAAFEMSHVAGARSIPLADIEADPTGLKLDKGQWIITYCT